MKKSSRPITCVLLAACMLLTGCFGSFKLTRKIYDVNSQVGDKYTREVVFLLFNIIPVYPACSFLDAVLFNAIEFWGGTNPLSLNEDKKENRIFCIKDKTFQVHLGKDKCIITELKGPQTGQQVELEHNPVLKNWTLKREGKLNIIASDLPDGTMNVFLPDGSIQHYNPQKPGFALASAPAGSM